jgi:hypothetical protein
VSREELWKSACGIGVVLRERIRTLRSNTGIVLAWLLVLAAVPASGQSSFAAADVNVKGRVVAAPSMEGIASASVVANGKVTVTDKDGRFVLTVPRGAIQLVIAADGYLADQVDLVVADRPLSVEVLLFRQTQFTEEVTVTGAPAPIAGPPAAIEVSPLQVRSVAGTADNIFRVLQTLPGVNATADFDSRIAVRGGGPDQNLTVMDGVEIHNPYRLFGLTSAFNPETVENFELTAGGFSPRFGDRLSSLLVVENRAGTRTKALGGSLNLAITDANVILEGKLPGAMTGSWLFTGRRTYYDLAASRFTDSQLPAFGDLQAKGEWEIRPGQRVTLFALRSRETTDASFSDRSNGNSVVLRDSGRNDLVAASFFSTIGSRLSSHTVASWYRYSDALGAGVDVRNEAARSNAPGDEAFARALFAITRDVAVRDASVRQEFSWKAANAHGLDAGVDAHLLETGWGWKIGGDRNFSQANGSSARGGAGLPALLDSKQDTWRGGAWLIDRWQATSRLLLEPGVRVDYSSLAGETIVSPRVSAGFAVAPGLRLRAAGGLFTQSPGYEKLHQSDYFVDLTAGTRLRSERSVHVLGAVEKDFAHGLTARVEAYYKSFDRIIVGRLETPAETAARVALYQFPSQLASSVPTSPQITSFPVNGGRGRAYGFDLFVARQRGSASDRFSGWASYTWGRADREAYGRRYAFDYDRRHAFSAVGAWRMSRLIELGASARIASGFPFTRPVGLKVAASAVKDESGATTAYVPQVDPNGLYVWTTDLGDVSSLNSSRLPVFARVDVRVTFRPKWQSNRWQFYAEVINVLNRENAGSLEPSLEYNPSGDRPTLVYKPSSALPLLPTFGVNLRF